jgi:hypothetical protein
MRFCRHGFGLGLSLEGILRFPGGDHGLAEPKRKMERSLCGELRNLKDMVIARPKHAPKG